MELLFRIPGEFDQLVHALKALGVAHVHFHHLIGHDDAILTLADQLRVGYDFTAHDYYSFCPQISLTDHTNRYCGEEGLDQCRACLKRSPAPGGVSIEQWRDKYLPFLQVARHVLAPSRDAAQRLSTFAPHADVCAVPHTDLALHAALPSLSPQRLSANQPLKIVVIGALSPIKGADVLDDVAKESAKAGAPLEFHLLGYAYRHLNTSVRDGLTVHGPYEEAELPTLLDRLKPDVVWFPALWPETYSYTLSACLSAGLPVVATDLGAFSERLAGRPWSWVRPWNSKPDDWLQFFNSIRVRHFLTGHAPEVLPATHLNPTDETHRPWQYETHYLQGIVKLPGGGTITDDFLAQHQPNRDADHSGAVQSVKSGLLPLVIRLRSAPVFSQVARRVPLRWQTRVKSWLCK
jgi:glycosyltransferase involved in cell wall biosynthesis